MPQTQVFLFRTADGETPIQEMLDRLKKRRPKIYAKCIQRLLALSREGIELSMPLSKPLGDGIYELRVRDGNVNYRMLYFFVGGAVVSHGFTKEDKIPPADITRAKSHRTLVQRDFNKHTKEFDL